MSALSPNPEPLKLAPAHKEAEVVVGRARFTVLTANLVRMEYSASRTFRDAATQTITNRKFEVPQFTVRRFDTPEGQDAGVEIRTSAVRVVYNGGPFSAASLSAFMVERAQDTHHTMWYYGDDPYSENPWATNLGGTTRTLDGVNGETALEPGLAATTGFALLDDSDSLPMTADGWVAPQRTVEKDLYFFAYGRRYQAAINAFFELSGPSPLLPRAALGNWWSRYHPYSAEEYLALMDEFEEQGLPFSVAVIDMDWHLVDIDPALGSGWTGYTWNRDLFPDPKAFLQDIHRRGMLTTLNVHPADGVRSHEDAYPEMARALDRDPQSDESIPFDIADRKFADAYFRYLHHPHEEDGVDFWWVDWQSGTQSSIRGLDPLWMLNYLHYTDTARDGKRPLTFSRYAGPGSHRYPIGFSGDTLISWESLRFQPHFTASAANIGYYWWSHDIGGHMMGIKDNELATRWVQFGVFSPIMRLHSQNSEFASKEPKMYGQVAQKIQTDFLQLRHCLVPYLYSAMWVSHREGTAPLRPMYHDYPASDMAYFARDQYMFGSDLIVAPIVEPRQEKSEVAQAQVWLPEGTWTDLFTATRYCGGRRLGMFRTLDTIPVLAREGAIITMASDAFEQIKDAPSALDLVLVPGERGEATLYEDDGSVEPVPHLTVFKATWDTDTLTLTGETPSANPQSVRELSLVLNGYLGAQVVTVNGEERDVTWDPTQFGARATLGSVNLAGGATIKVAGLERDQGRRDRAVRDLIDKAQISFLDKEVAWGAYAEAQHPALAIPTWLGLDIPDPLKGALVELVTTD